MSAQIPSRFYLAMAMLLFAGALATGVIGEARAALAAIATTSAIAIVLLECWKTEDIGGGHADWRRGLTASLLSINVALLQLATAAPLAFCYTSMLVVACGIFLNYKLPLLLVVVFACLAEAVASAIAAPELWVELFYLNAVAALAAFAIQARRRSLDLAHATVEAARAGEGAEEPSSALIENAPGLAFAVDEHYVLTAVNPAFRDLIFTMYQAELQPGKPLLEALPKDVGGVWRERLARAVGGQRLMVEDRYDVAGSATFYELAISPISERGERCSATVFGRDITRHKNLEAALRDSQERYALAVAGAHDGIWDWDLHTGKIYLSPQWEQLLGFDPGTLSESSEEWLKRVHPDESHRLSEALRAHINGKTSHFECEHRLKHADGAFRWFLARGLVVRDAREQPARIAGSLTDITNRKQVEERLITEAFTDTVTELPNRALFLNRLEHVMLRSARNADAVFAVLLLDVDRLKVINESLGHALGDRLLEKIARRLQECVRPGDTVSRIGGDEFAVLLEEVKDHDDAAQVAGRIRQAFSSPFILAGQQLFATLSIGIAFSRERYLHPQELLRDAELALFRAKARGQATHEFFQTGMHEGAKALLRLENDLRKAVERDEFVLFFQPIVDINSRALQGFEALIRWQHPERGVVPPAEFIFMAEETGLIVPLGRWVFSAVCSQVRAWNKMTDLPFYVSCNVSPKQLSDPEYVKRLGASLEQCAVPPHQIRLEITESAIVEDDAEVNRILHVLGEMQLKLYLDDFGTGYSSLSYLHRLPVQGIKIDRSFVSRLTPDSNDAGLVETIVSLARSLKMELIAEGVETEWQLSTLRRLECDCVQGMAISEPLDSSKATSWIAKSGV